MKGIVKVLRTWRGTLLALATLLVVGAMPASAAAAGAPYGSGAYNSTNYNGTATSTGTSTAGAPNTGAGLYSPGQSSSKSSRVVNWIELAGGAVLVVAGIGGFWFLSTHKHRSTGIDS